MATLWFIYYPVLSLRPDVWLLIIDFYTRTIMGMWGTDIYEHIQRQ